MSDEDNLNEVALLDESLLEALYAEWTRQSAPIAERLRPGLSDEKLDELSMQLGLELPYEARVWWGWRNGVASEPNALASRREIGWGKQFLPLGEAIAATIELREFAAANDELGSISWGPTWLAITQNGRLACECDVPGHSPSPIRDGDPHYWGEEAGPILAGSFGEAVRCWVDAMRSGGWSYDLALQRWDVAPDLLPPGSREGLV